MNGSAGISTTSNVRVFFRLFVSQSFDTDYHPSTAYSSDPPVGLPKSPRVGIDSNGTVTSFPFFATGNYEASPVNKDYSNDSVNNRALTNGAKGAVWAYYGCYLNVYDQQNTLNGKALPLVGDHHCLVAQIAYDGSPIPPPTSSRSLSPRNCDKLAQRNLQITPSDNPGPASAHVVPQMFDAFPTASFLDGEPRQFAELPR